MLISRVRSSTTSLSKTVSYSSLKYKTKYLSSCPLSTLPKRKWQKTLQNNSNNSNNTFIKQQNRYYTRDSSKNEKVSVFFYFYFYFFYFILI